MDIPDVPADWRHGMPGWTKKYIWGFVILSIPFGILATVFFILLALCIAPIVGMFLLLIQLLVHIEEQKRAERAQPKYEILHRTIGSDDECARCGQFFNDCQCQDGPHEYY